MHDAKTLAAELRTEGELLARQPELGEAFREGTRIFRAADALEGLAEAERERDALKRDLAMRPSSLTTLYEVRKAMGLNEYFPLSHLETHCQSARRVLYGEPIPPANESLLDLAERMRRSLHDYQARVIPAESKIVELEGRVADLEAELASARRGILPDYPPDYPGGFDGPTGAD